MHVQGENRCQNHRQSELGCARERVSDRHVGLGRPSPLLARDSGLCLYETRVGGVGDLLRDQAWHRCCRHHPSPFSYADAKIRSMSVCILWSMQKANFMDTGTFVFRTYPRLWLVDKAITTEANGG